MSSHSLWQQLSSDLVAQARAASSVLVRIDVPAGRPATGLLVAPDLVIAADHALASDEELGVALEAQQVTATGAGRDPSNDLAAIRASGLGGTPLPLADELPPVGALLLGVWRDWRGGLAAGLTSVAGLPGPIRAGHGKSLDRLIRTALAPARGISGGALVDAAGTITGLLTAGLARGTVVALPAAAIRRTIEELQAHGRIRRGYLGVALQRVRLPQPQRAEADQRTALLVIGVEEEGPAGRAGVRVGDLILRCEGERLTEVEELQAALRADRVGQPIALDLLRGGSALRLAVIVGER